MDKRLLRLGSWTLVWVVGALLWWNIGGVPLMATETSVQWTIPPVQPVLVNPGFECGVGYTQAKNPLDEDVSIPSGWRVIYVDGAPRVLSTRMWSNNGNCDPNGGGYVTRMEGLDSWYLRSQDIATPPLPGKPFDVVLYQQVPATYGGAYSLSGWLASECGDNPDGANPCPNGQYIVKAVGIDPNGGVDPDAPGIEWAENRTDRRWHNVFTSATALTSTVTIYARVTSPFQFHNNKGFVDAFSLVRAPLSALYELPPTILSGSRLTLSWHGQQSEDVAAIAGGKYELLFDVQARALPGGEWREVVTGTTTQMSAEFVAPCMNMQYQFRVRARAEQLENGGASPNHRYLGVWSKPQTVFFSGPMVTPGAPITDTVTLTPTVYIPLAGRNSAAGC